MPEFALVAPILFLIIFGIFDFGHGIYEYITIQTAANEAARVAVQGVSGIGGGSAYAPVNTAAVIGAATQNVAGLQLVPAPVCVNGPIPQLSDLEDSTNKATYISPNSGWVFVSDAEPVSSWPAYSAKNCNSQPPAGGNVPVQVTVVFHYSPITPLIGNIIGQHIFFPIYSVYLTEY